MRDAYHEARDREREDEARFTVLMCVYLLLFVAVAGGVSWRTHAVRRACFALGYPQSSWGPLQGAYCIARVDQSDVVIPLAQARMRPRR